IPVEADIAPFPSRLAVSVEGTEEGTESRSFELPYLIIAGPLGAQLGVDPRTPISEPFIKRIEESNTYVINLGGVTETLTEARETFGDQPNVFFTEEIQGRFDEDIGLTGENLANAYADQHHATGQPIVVVEFDIEGTKIFGELTEQIAGLSDHQVAIFLDEDELISPEVTTAITAGTAIIQGADFTVERVRDLALLLESGRLPTPIDLIAERDVDAILGADSLSKSVVAGLVGLGLVLLFMALYYRVPGVIAAVALVFYALLILAIFKILPITLTLSGVGAVILSIGMAVDANILIFERMKDELRAGRTLMSAINIGFNRAWPAIRDGNVSTLITCAILFYFSDQLGTTVVQGFASALAIGVLLSMFSAIVVSRTILRVVANTGMSHRLEWFVPSGGADLPQQRMAAPVAQRS
ncbi:MAG: protein translocase subunit SecD, partial [Dehalococcoidia bacterium]|nr:protein translocase subunit SecD [Dehalococcoidia bacterium]